MVSRCLPLLLIWIAILAHGSGLSIICQMKPSLPWCNGREKELLRISFNHQGKSKSIALFQKQAALRVSMLNGSLTTVAESSLLDITGMAFQPKQFRTLVVRPVLKHLDPEIPYSTQAEELIMFTIAHESDMGTFLAQYPKDGPAKGISMIEEKTFNWLVEKLWLKPDLQEKFRKLSISYDFLFKELSWNLALAVAFARLRYYAVPEELPLANDGAWGLARYWGKYYQTTSDPIKLNEAVRDYKRFVY